MESSPISSINSLDVTNLSFFYQGWAGEDPPSLFENLSFSIPKGSKALLLAPFDSGKSTLGRMLVGGIPKYFPGRWKAPSRSWGMICRYRNLGSLDVVTPRSQNPQEQFVASTVEEEVAFALESLGLPQKEMRRRVEDGSDKLGHQ